MDVDTMEVAEFHREQGAEEAERLFEEAQEQARAEWRVTESLLQRDSGFVSPAERHKAEGAAARWTELFTGLSRGARRVRPDGPAPGKGPHLNPPAPPARPAVLSPLRDQFAAHAMAAIVANPVATARLYEYAEARRASAEAEIAERAYGLADAMLAARGAG